MQAMRLALAFRRPDVDTLLAELDADQFAEWTAFMQLEPQGWQATNLVQARLGYLIVGNPKAKERKFLMRMEGGGDGGATESARLEAFAIRQNIGAERHG